MNKYQVFTSFMQYVNNVIRNPKAINLMQLLIAIVYKILYCLLNSIEKIKIYM